MKFPRMDQMWSIVSEKNDFNEERADENIAVFFDIIILYKNALEVQIRIPVTRSIIQNEKTN